jgi:sensor histidine kinase YesM
MKISNFQLFFIITRHKQIKSKKRMFSINRTKMIDIFTNTLAWVIVLVFPFFTPIQYSHQIDYGHWITHIVMTILLAICYYSNYFIFIEKFFMKKKYEKYIILNIIIIVVFAVITYIVAEYTRIIFKPNNIYHLRRMEPDFNLKIGMLFNMMTSFFLTVGFSIGVKLAYYWMKTANKEEKMKNLRIQTELQTIRYQLSPHFIVNTLNNIYSLIDISKEKAQENIIELSRLLRYILYESDNSLVPLQKEIEFYESYISLMKIRQRKDVNVNVNISINKNTIHQISPLLFIGLIENAFKHGVSSTESSFITINIKEEGDKIICEVENTNFPKKDNDRSGGGIGLKQLEKRLKLLYEGKYEYEKGIYDNIYKVKLIIHF